MALAPHTRLGAYEVTGLLGEGGMGEVYRAVDTRLDRQVAIKVLPEAVRADPERVARFEREAKLLASLNHQNIAGIYGLEQASGEQFIVMELVEGPTLADRIAEGPIPIAEALPIAKQMAEALEAAHEAGVIHRDLKPANVKLTVGGAPPPRNEDILNSRRDPTPARAAGARLERRLSAADVGDCTVKVLDFGLAKALGGDPRTSPASLTNSPTIASPVGVTGVGMLLGTAAYMSPEQAKGRTVDQRADIWALGCVVYEMLTGTTPFAGESVAETLSAVLTREPDWTRLPAATPAPIRRTLEQCLRKDLASRRRSAADLVLEFRDESLEVPQPVRTEPRRRLQAGTVIVSLVAAAFAAAATWAFAPRADRGPGRRPMRFSLQLPAGLSISMPAGGSPIAFAPSGDTIAYVADNAEGQVHLCVQSLDRDAPIVVEGSAMAQSPSFSPDGQTVAFLSGGDLFVARTDGTAARTIATDAVPLGLIGGAAGVTSWTDADTVVVGDPLSGKGARAYSVGTGTMSERTTLASGETGHTWLAPGSAQPASDSLLLATWPNRQVMFQPRRGVGLVPVIDQAVAPRIVGQDFLVFAREGGIWASRFDQRTGRVIGRPQAVLENLARNAVGNPLFAVSPTGVLAYQASSGARPVAIRWVDRQGNEEAAAVPEGLYQSPSIGPDGLSVAVGLFAADPRDSQSLGLWTFRHGRAGRVLVHRGPVRSSVWSNDGRALFFTTIDGELLSGPADGSSPAAVIGRLPGRAPMLRGLTLDGRRLIVSATFDPEAGTEIGAFDLAVGGSATRLFQEDGIQDFAALSPDGRWLAYTSTQSGASEIYVRPYPDVASNRWKVSESGGTEPRWTRGGRELLYWSAANEIMSVQLTANVAFTATRPTRLIDKRLSSAFDLPGRYDVTRDGERMIVIGPAPSEWTHLSIVLNWDVELREKLARNAEAR